MTTDSLPRFFEGDFTGRATKVEYGEGKNGKPTIRVTMEIAAGPRTGTQVQYSANFKQESIKYTKRDMLALGWQGRSVSTLVDDITKAALIVPFSVRIAEYTNPDTGKTSQWNSVGSIGNAAPPLSAPSQDTTRNVDSWFADADDQGGGGYGGSQRHPNAPDGDIPFASAELASEPSAMPPVLRRGS